ncbi:DCC1-like thiol-disulfide oxidoreductase family protein [Streptomyces sp. NPDC004542]|uniref:thiol-disulfide oxidoreductase DCC family protein n=1 Tax=Streptomyces sp. NPDC004542 TaxID=3154281 RepID=UPI0033AC520A
MRVPVRGLTVLYDADCALCAFVRDWLVRQRQLVPLELVPAGSDEARARFPSLDHGGTLDEITVVGDAGQVYRGATAWVVVLWALREHRPLAHRLSTPAGAALAKGAVLAAARWRGAQWGGKAYRRAAVNGGGAQRLVEGRGSGGGWAYRPSQGWSYAPPGCDGGTCGSR